MDMRKLIYIVEDEADIAELVAIRLQSAGFDTRVFPEAASMLRAMEETAPDLLVLDLMLPDMDGIEVCKHLRASAQHSQLPIIMLTARVDVADKVRGLEVGADDYIAKPFEARELVARVNSVLRRSGEESSASRLSIPPGLVLDLIRHECSIDNVRIDLTLTELRILKLLISKPGKVYSRAAILDHLWGTDKIVIERSVDVHIKNLREKLGDYARFIQNIRGLGYKYELRP